MQPFVSALGTELGLTSKEIADIIWLALQMQNSDEATETSTPLELSAAAETTDERSRPSPENFIPPTGSDEKPDLASQTKAAEVHLNQPNAKQASFGKQLALKVPDARSLREPLSLARSLKPLLRRVITGWSTVLDEAATVDRIAAEQLWLPVLKPALEPWLDLALVVDDSASMQLWQRTIAELQRLLSHYGVFRDVRVWGLVTDAQGQVQLRPGLGAAARRLAARRPSELLDPSGRRLILVATDCVSSGWQDGSLLPALKLWATGGPLAIVQMLPEWLWSRTGLGFASAVRLQSLLPGVPNQQLIAKDLSPWDEVDLDAGLKVPVVTLEPEQLAAWTEMVMGKGGAWSPGFVFEPEVVTPNGQVAQLLDTAVEDLAEQRVQRFRVTASPMARRLAGLLAAAPVISLPVVRIIQDRLLSKSRQVHVAEVFLGGLLKPLVKTTAKTNPDAVQYDFLDGVREALLESVPTSDSVNALQEVSKFVAERLGLSLDAFVAVLRNPQQTKDRNFADQSRPFAMVTAQILRQLGGEYVQFAEELERQHTEPKQDLADNWKQKQRFTKTPEIPCLSLAIAPLRAANHFAVHVTKAPYPGGYVLHDCVWAEAQKQLWLSWQEMFSARSLPNVPQVSQVEALPPNQVLPLETLPPAPGQPVSQSGRLMQNLGISLWQWLFGGPIQDSFDRSRGIAMGQAKPLRLRLEVRDPNLVLLPWEGMQDGAGKQPISLRQQLLFSRTTSDVNSLPPLRSDNVLKILLVLGQDYEPLSSDSLTEPSSNVDPSGSRTLQLEQEANTLAHVLTTSNESGLGIETIAPCHVDTLVQPTPAALISQLEKHGYNIFFYAGHGIPAPDGGLLFLRPNMTLTGIELAQVLTRYQVKLAVFNACWGAQPDAVLSVYQGAQPDHETVLAIPTTDVARSQAIPRSSLVEVLINQGVPAVLGMRDSITDEEALSFIQAFARALSGRVPIDQAVAVARQHLLTLYRFNQQAWTLPVLYMHPEFDGELLQPLEGSMTAMPGPIIRMGQPKPDAALRSLATAKVWLIQGGFMRVGRDRAENDLVLQEDQGGVSRKHAVIFCRQSQSNDNTELAYFLEDFSRFGTWILEPGAEADTWRKVHRQEVQLQPGSRLKFGSVRNEAVEFCGVEHSEQEFQ